MYAASSALRTAPKSVRLSARRVAGRGTFQRFQSTATSSVGTPPPSYGASHVVAGVGGGAVVLLGGYAYYHMSGAKKAVDASRTVSTYYQQTKDAITANAPKNPNEAVTQLRNFAQSYLVMIPGARPHVDAVFDTVDKLQESHGEEVDRLVSGTYEELRDIVRDAKTVDAAMAMKVLAVLQQRSSELQELGKKAGKDAFGSLSEKYPQLSEKLGGGYDEFKKLVEAHGPEAKKMYEDTSRQITEIFSKGFSQDGIDQARRLIQSKAEELRKVAKSSSQGAWDRALKEAGPYLDKFPEVKQLLSENADKFIAAGAASLAGGSSGTQEIFARIKDAAQGDLKDKNKMKELRDFVQEKVREAEDSGSKQLERGWESLQQWVRAMPGGEDALKRMPDVKVFVKVSQEKSEDAKKLAKETYEAVLEVLEEKGKKAKRLADEVQKDAKKSS